MMKINCSLSHGKYSNFNAIKSSFVLPRITTTFWIKLISSLSILSSNLSLYQLIIFLKTSRHYDIVKKNENVAKESIDEDVHDVEVYAKTFCNLLMIYDHVVILFFIGKLLYISWIKQWLNTIVSLNCVENIYVR